MARVNPWLQEKLGKVHSPELNLIVETQPDKALAIASDLNRLPKVTAYPGRISWGRFIPIIAPKELIPQIQRLPGVVEVHYNMPKTIKAFSILDPLVGEVKLSEVEVPGSPLDGVLSLPFAPLASLFDFTKQGYEFIPTGRIRELVKAPEDNTVNTKVAVLDTGSILPFHPLAVRKVDFETVIPEPPWDMLGHGVFCHTTAFLGDAETRFGRVRGIADAVNSMHVKCLDSRGFGTTQDLLEAMELAYKWGAKVVSMSLGGPLQGSALADDPECKIIRETRDEMIWVVAAGNSGQPWSINSPGASPYALTVGSYSPQYADVSLFSSRGPNGEYYQTHPDVWTEDYGVAGEDLMKPDVLAPGGGPCKQGQTPVDLVYSGCQGWTDGEYDLSPVDGFAGMRGSSMATAVAAGLIALLFERKGMKTAEAIKEKLRAVSGEKSSVYGYGLISYDLF